MSYTNAGTIDRRDAAVASALAGLVVVILGYASGLGLQTSSATPAPSVSGPSAVPPSATAPDGADTSPDDPGHGSSVHGTTGSDQHTASGGHGQTEHTDPADAHTDPTTPHIPAPTSPPASEPAPTDPARTCGSGLLEGLPVASSLAGPVSSLLTTVVGSPSQSGLLACTVGTVVGPACCSTQATGTEPGR